MRSEQLLRSRTRLDPSEWAGRGSQADQERAGRLIRRAGGRSRSGPEPRQGNTTGRPGRRAAADAAGSHSGATGTAFVSATNGDVASASSSSSLVLLLLLSSAPQPVKRARRTLGAEGTRQARRSEQQAKSRKPNAQASRRRQQSLLLLRAFASASLPVRQSGSQSERTQRQARPMTTDSSSRRFRCEPRVVGSASWESGVWSLELSSLLSLSRPVERFSFGCLRLFAFTPLHWPPSEVAASRRLR